MKNQLKNISVPILSSRVISPLATFLFGSGIPVFMLHRITDNTDQNRVTTTQHLRQCLEYLTKNQYSFISLETFIQSLVQHQPLPDKAVVFTMDDGYLDQAEIAAPIFLEFNCPLTFFVITGLLDGILWPWDAQASWIINHSRKNQLSMKLDDETIQVNLPAKDDRYLIREQIRNTLKEIDAEQIPDLIQQLAVTSGVELPDTLPDEYQPINWEVARKLENRGIQFAPHSVSHNILSKLNPTRCKQEILGSWQTLKRELKQPLNIFCYPTGRKLDFGPREIDILRQSGFIGAVATTPGYINSEQTIEQQIFRIPRFELPAMMTDFIQCCSWIEYAKRSNG